LDAGVNPFPPPPPLLDGDFLQVGFFFEKILKQPKKFSSYKKVRPSP